MASWRRRIFWGKKWWQNVFRSKGIIWYVKEAEKVERNNSKTNLKITFKAAATYKFRVTIWAFSLWEYFYILSKSGLTLKHRAYTINQSDEDLL